MKNNSNQKEKIDAQSIYEPNSTVKADLVIVKDKNTESLSKQQVQFNKLTKQVEKLQRDIVARTEACDNVLKEYSERVLTVKKGIVECQMFIIESLDEKSESYKLSKKNKETLQQVILSLFDLVFQEVMPDEKQEELFNKWSDANYKDIIQEEHREMADIFGQGFKQMFGFDIDLSKFDGTPESIIEIQEQLKNKIGDKTDFTPPPRKKTKKQQQKELEEKHEQEQKAKSIRSLYYTLVKALHPDKEQDQEEKLRKEELMKKVTVAYEEKNLTTLLKLELEWVAMETDHLSKLTDDKLKLYISLLKEQVADLKDEYNSILHDPRYQCISHYRLNSPQSALGKLSLDENYAKDLLEVMQAFCLSLSNINSKNDFVSTVKQLNEFVYTLQEDDEDDFFDFLERSMF